MLDERFELYADASSLDRASAVLDGSRGVSGAERAARDARQAPGLSVVVLNLDQPGLILPLVEQLREQREVFRRAKRKLEILVGDTGSTVPEVLAAYDDWQDVVVVRGLFYHFSRCNNRVARRAACDTLLFLNNDVILPRPDALWDLYQALWRDPEAGVMGAVMYFPDGRIQHCGVDFFREPPHRAFPFHVYARQRLAHELPPIFAAPAATGAFLLIRRPVFEAVGGFPEYYAVEAQDIDMCLRVHRLGHLTRVVNLGNTVHLENATRPKGEEHWPDRRLFLRRWRSYVETHFL